MAFSMTPVWRWFHRWTSPPNFYRIARPWALGLMLVGGVALLVAWIWGLVFAPEDYLQGNSYRIIFVHVPSASASLAMYLSMAILAVISLVWKIKLADMVLRQCIPVGLTLTALALISGAIWGRPTWGVYWIWDARLTSMLVQLFLFIGMWAIHTAIEQQKLADKATAILVLVGFVNLPIIKWSVDWWNTMHQPATIRITGETTMVWEMLAPLLLSMAATYCVVAALVLYRTRWEILYRERKTRWVQDELGLRGQA
ncbi:MAG: heme ABC transporter permease CcmC [Natronospirillum sp.]|uniref:heme ABC transporter permease CcmC n=1 Tax=Natronospirillum sp. TaxID=2812955 RepID=UPI0025D694A3|nr:heme ABC transporter permease CcmC [Natronospirillum sp.]MCH8551391.1 heme ABC transporter permease CcmC [Natronospirillum sp.]